VKPYADDTTITHNGEVEGLRHYPDYRESTGAINSDQYWELSSYNSAFYKDLGHHSNPKTAVAHSAPLVHHPNMISPFVSTFLQLQGYNGEDHFQTAGYFALHLYKLINVYHRQDHPDLRAPADTISPVHALLGWPPVACRRNKGIGSPSALIPPTSHTTESSTKTNSSSHFHGPTAKLTPRKPISPLRSLRRPRRAARTRNRL
jgi:hypothetical protein